MVHGAPTSYAPFGFSFQWMKKSDFDTNAGWYPSADSRLCKASFSGQPATSNYNLLTADDVAIITFGDLILDDGASTNCGQPLVCGTDYVFHAFAHAGTSGIQFKKSAFTTDQIYRTAPCQVRPEFCTKSQGYWKEHVLPLELDGKFKLGGITYSNAQISAFLNQDNKIPGAKGANLVVNLGRQVVAYKLNVLLNQIMLFPNDQASVDLGIANTFADVKVGITQAILDDIEVFFAAHFLDPLSYVAVSSDSVRNAYVVKFDQFNTLVECSGDTIRLPNVNDPTKIN
jgi:hypothetical protein